MPSFGEGLVEKIISSCRTSGEDRGDTSADEFDMVLAGGGGRLFIEDRYDDGLKDRAKLAMLSPATRTCRPLIRPCSQPPGRA